MNESKPKIFIASSTEGLDIAYAIQENLEHVAEVTVWPQGMFDLSEYTLDDLLKQLDLHDFGIFVFSFEDILKIRDEEVRTTRDNVLFELGLFIGRLGRQRNYIVMPKSSDKLHLPTDLLGIKPATYEPKRSDNNLLAALGSASNQVRRSISKHGLREKDEKFANYIVKQANDAGLTAFYQSREDYGKYRKDASTIDTYVSTADKSIHMVSINLMTGIPFDDLCSVLENKLEQKNSSFTVSISLLNPWKQELMISLSPVLKLTPSKLADSIKTSLTELYKLKKKLSQQAKKRFEIRIHNAIPFGSAIILDGNTGNGKIQIETKPYKVQFRKSIAFEVSDDGNNNLFRTLRDAYLQLISDGTTYESMLELSRKNRNKR